jgi:hypothetical protein
MLKGEPEWSTKQLLDEIKAEAVRGADCGNLNYLMPAFSALLVKLSNAADARKLVVLTWVLVVLTVAIAVLTAILLGQDFGRE